MKSKKLERKLKNCEAMQNFLDGFVVDPGFENYTPDNLCTIQLRVVMKVSTSKIINW